MTNRPTLQQRVRAALRELGRTPDEIARSLKRRRVKGYRREAGDCPLAVYLRRKFRAKRVTVCMAAFLQVGDKLLKVTLSGPHHAFVVRFDAGHYPELEARP